VITLEIVKERLHDYNEHADDKKLKAIYTILENDMEEDWEIDEAQIKELDKGWNDYMSGKSKSIPSEKAMDNLSKYIENKRKHAV
jgi:hypothetical protein